jgi:uncharacterized protein with HEPN domain
MTASDANRLRHMLDAAREAVEFGAGQKRDDLIHNRVLALALVRCIEIIGEAAAKVSPELRSKYPEIPWADIIGMRHRLVHAYYEIDLGRICDTLTADLPPMISQLERILQAYQ